MFFALLLKVCCNITRLGDWVHVIDMEGVRGSLILRPEAVAILMFAASVLLVTAIAFGF